MGPTISKWRVNSKIHRGSRNASSWALYHLKRSLNPQIISTKTHTFPKSYEIHPNHMNPKPKIHFDEGSKVRDRNGVGLISEWVQCVVCRVLCWASFKSQYAPLAYATSKKNWHLMPNIATSISPIRIPSQLLGKLNTSVWEGYICPILVYNVRFSPLKFTRVLGALF